MTFGDPKLPERIWSRIIPVPWVGCWVWEGELDRWGYGRVWYNGKKRMVHRVLYSALKGRIYRTLDHQCVWPACCNPAHMKDVTQRKNNILAIQRRHLDKYGIYVNV